MLIIELPYCRRNPSQSSTNNQDRAGPSDFQSFSDSIKSRFSAMSMRYMGTLISFLITLQLTSSTSDNLFTCFERHVLDTKNL